MAEDFSFVIRGIFKPRSPEVSTEKLAAWHGLSPAFLLQSVPGLPETSGHGA